MLRMRMLGSESHRTGKIVMPYLGNREPLLDEVFNDHIVHLVMARDRLAPEEVRTQVEAVRHQLRQRRDSRA